MDLKRSKRLLLILACIYWVFAVGIYAIANEQFHFSTVSEKASNPEYVIGEIVDGMELRQQFASPSQMIDGVDILTATYARENSGTLLVAVLNSAGDVLAETAAEISGFADNAYSTITFDQRLEVAAGELLTIQLSTDNCVSGNAITLYAGKTPLSEMVSDVYLSDGAAGEGYLCIRVNGTSPRNDYKIYWIVITSAFVLLVIYTLFCWRDAKRGKSNPVVSICTVYSRYSFLIKQLVSLDFKTKYKRSTLGMAWSFMNPLLTMSVQYIVFSTLFKSDIPNYPVYLLTGIVFFSFFNEAVTMGMTSITSNAALIKKVYMPKYIYPVSRILSSLVNFAFAMMPLFLVILFTGTPVKPSMLLLIYVILCMLAFITGMTLLLTTAMTFFQDTQFLWSVVSMMWQYLTPIFYPETIIPESYLPIYRLNPMYQFISFARTCVTEGVSPEPMAYVGCLLAGGIFLLLGIIVFKRHQNKFVLYV